MTKTYIINKGQKPTPEQIREISEATKHPITFDEDCPELSPALEKAAKASIFQRNNTKNA